jgi:signal peptidase II
MKKFSILSAITISSIACACILLGVSLLGYTRIFFNNNDEWFLIIMDIKNDGLALSFLSGKDVLYLAGIQFACLLILSFVNTKSKSELFGWILVMSGGFANLFERIVFSEVTDYIYIGFFGFQRFPIFNAADLLIAVGAVFLLQNIFRSKKTTDNV